MRSSKAALITSSLLTPLLVAGGMLAAAGPAAAGTGHGQRVPVRVEKRELIGIRPVLQHSQV